MFLVDAIKQKAKKKFKKLYAKIDIWRFFFMMSNMHCTNQAPQMPSAQQLVAELQADKQSTMFPPDGSTSTNDLNAVSSAPDPASQLGNRNYYKMAGKLYITWDMNRGKKNLLVPLINIYLYY